MTETSPNDIVVEEELDSEDVDGQHTTISHQSDHLSANNKTVGLMESGLTLQG